MAKAKAAVVAVGAASCAGDVVLIFANAIFGFVESVEKDLSKGERDSVAPASAASTSSASVPRS
eukprot:2859912-Pleurochrysis_carterae.AAC.2